MSSDLDTCPDEEIFMKLQDGLLDEDARQELMVHIDACPSCFELLSMLTSMEHDSETYPVAELKPPKATKPRIGRYEILEQAGMGGVGVVYKTRDTRLNRLVALKLLRPDILATDPEQAKEATQRLKREAQTLAALEHPHIVTIYDIDTHEDKLFTACAFIDGENLREWMRSEIRDWRTILELFVQVADGLAAAHQVGIIHRDVKPENILVRDGHHALLTDFGMATRPTQMLSMSVSTDELSTQQGMILGTPAYMSPEQLDGQAPHEASDQFAFCVTLYEALYGFRPYHAETYQELLHVLKQGTPVRPQSRTIPTSLFDVLAQGLLPRPGERHTSMQALRQELVHILKEPVLADTPTAGLSAKHVTGVVALIAVMTLGGLVIARTQHNTPTQPVEENNIQLKGLSTRVEAEQSPTPPDTLREEQVELARAESPAPVDNVVVHDDPPKIKPTLTSSVRETKPRATPPAGASGKVAPPVAKPSKSRGLSGNALVPNIPIPTGSSPSFPAPMPSTEQRNAFMNAVLALDGKKCQSIYNAITSEYPSWVATHPKNYWRMRCELLQGECKHIKTFEKMLPKDKPLAMSEDMVRAHNYKYAHPSCFSSDSEKLTYLATLNFGECSTSGETERCIKNARALHHFIKKAKLTKTANEQVIEALDYNRLVIKDCDTLLDNLYAQAVARAGGRSSMTLDSIMEDVDGLGFAMAIKYCPSRKQALKKLEAQVGSGQPAAKFLTVMYIKGLQGAISESAGEDQILDMAELAMANLEKVSKPQRGDAIKTFEGRLDYIWRRYTESSCERTLKLWNKEQEFVPQAREYAQKVIDRNRRNRFSTCMPKEEPK